MCEFVLSGISPGEGPVPLMGQSLTPVRGMLIKKPSPGGSKSLFHRTIMQSK
jgi:hypothetical protein